MSVTFYYAPRSSATRVHWALEELQVPYAKVKVDTAAGDQRKPDYLRINPNGKVPCLVDESTPVFESLAIIIHLGERYGVERGLWPAVSSPAHGQALSWTIWSAVTLGATAGQAFGAGERNDRARAELAGLLDILDRRLTETSHVLGPTFTLVDLANVSVLAQYARRGLELGAYPRVQEWYTRSAARPAHQTVLQD